MCVCARTLTSGKHSLEVRLPDRQVLDFPCVLSGAHAGEGIAFSTSTWIPTPEGEKPLSPLTASWLYSPLPRNHMLPAFV